ncbi:MAG TPA: ATP-binding protein [Albitalea sp.]|uniref:ATP-binding protein n=1 Tax=Piscinibacter sp. TaxID=1903157 RepID=UPI002ED1C212
MAEPALHPDFFGTDEEIAALEQRADAASRVTLAWFLRQRDTRAALRHADAASLPPDAHRAHGRLALVRGEAAWLLGEMDEAQARLAQARDAFEAISDSVGLGDAHLLHASLLDQTGGDRAGALRAAGAEFRRAADPLRIRISDTWSACVEATARPDDAEASWGAALEEAAALHQPGLDTYTEAARGTLAWRRGDPAGAIACFMRGFEAALACGQLQSAVTLAQNIGIAFSTLNDHEGALDWAARARALVEPTGWPYATGWCLMQTASILLGLHRPQAAKEMLLERMPVLAPYAGSRNHTLACQILGEALLDLGEDAQALHWCELAHRGAQGLPYPDLVAGSLRHMAQALSGLGRVDDAVAAARRGLAIAEAEHDWQRVATIHHVMAGIADRHGLPPPEGSPARNAAIHHLEAALEAGARMPGFAAPPEWQAELAAAHEAAGDLRRALTLERSASLARTALQSRQVEATTTATLLRHDTERALAEARHQRALAEASELRAALLETQSALEKERMQSLLVHAGKMVAIGRIASGVVHEMSHPVGTLLLLAEALADRLRGAPPELGASLATLVAETRRLQQFVVRLRDFARAEPPQLAPHDLREVLADARQLFGPRLALERIAYVEEVAALPVQVDPQRLALALANLVFNAADALAGASNGQIRIEAGCATEIVELHVDDNGPGLPEAVRARLFEPFFTTKPEGKGLGLGLALSAESLAAMGGRIVAENRPEGGARFTVVLPRVIDDPGCTRATNLATRAP